MIYEGSVQVQEMMFCGNLKVIARIKDGKIIKVTTMDGTEINIKSTSDCAGYWEDQILESWNAKTNT